VPAIPPVFASRELLEIVDQEMTTGRNRRARGILPSRCAETRDFLQG